MTSVAKRTQCRIIGDTVTDNSKKISKAAIANCEFILEFSKGTDRKLENPQSGYPTAQTTIEFCGSLFSATVTATMLLLAQQ